MVLGAACYSRPDRMQNSEEDIWAAPPSEAQPKIALLISLGVRCDHSAARVLCCCNACRWPTSLPRGAVRSPRCCDGASGGSSRRSSPMLVSFSTPSPSRPSSTPPWPHPASSRPYSGIYERDSHGTDEHLTIGVFVMQGRARRPCQLQKTASLQQCLRRRQTLSVQQQSRQSQGSMQSLSRSPAQQRRRRAMSVRRS